MQQHNYSYEFQINCGKPVGAFFFLVLRRFAFFARKMDLVQSHCTYCTTVLNTSMYVLVHTYVLLLV